MDLLDLRLGIVNIKQATFLPTSLANTTPVSTIPIHCTIMPEIISSLKRKEALELLVSVMMNNILLSVIIGLFTLSVFESSAQPAKVSVNKSNADRSISDRKYAVGVMALSRISVADVRYGFDKHLWLLNGGGIAALRYSSNRTFWSIGIAYAKVGQLTQEPGPDFRFIEDTSTNLFSEVRVGSQTTVWRGTYYTVPVNFHHLLTKSKRTNVYITGGVVLDLARRHVLEVTSTYDGRTDYPIYGTFRDVSATVQGGLGLYQPLGKNWIATAGVTVGHAFFSELEQSLTARGAPGIASFDLRVYYCLP